MNYFFRVFISFFSFSIAFGQNKIEHLNVKFGKITPTDFVINSTLVDSNTNAVVLSDIGNSEFTANSKGGFSLVFKRHRRIKIINDKGYDIAAVSIYLYSSGTQTERLEQVNGYTYNLENNELVTQKLESKDVFEERLSKSQVRKKFTFPGVKAGSIIEYTYSIQSDFLFNLQPWEFQSDYPCLWSEYKVAVPDYFNYVFLSQGYQPFHINTKSDYTDNFLIRSAGSYGEAPGNFRVSTTIHSNRWVMVNIPALKEEKFTYTIDNHNAKIEFQLSQYRFPDEPIKEVMGTWATVSEKLLERDDFGKAFLAENNFLESDLAELIKTCTDVEEKARKIYSFIRDKFTCTKYAGIYMDDFVSLRDVYKKKSGTVAEINVLLIAMLRKAKIPADPVILSLRSRGVVHLIYPLLNRFNYLICETQLNGKKIYLDAAKPFLGFGKLDKSCYNGSAWVLSKSPNRIEFTPDSLLEQKVIAAFFINDEKGNYTGTVTFKLGNDASALFREKRLSNSKQDFINEFSKGIIGDAKVADFEFDSSIQKEDPISFRYDVDMKFEEDLIYFNPLFGQELKENPFKAANRLYPVEMPYQQDEIFVLDIEVPNGYNVDEIPKSVKYILDEGGSLFEYICKKVENKIQLRSRIIIKRAIFQQDDYTLLREFYSFILKKSAEQIVFRKKIN